MLHDSALYESAGNPAVALVTDKFKPQSAYQARMLGFEDAQVTWIEHPISDNSQDTIHRKTEKAFDSIIEQLTVAAHRPLKGIVQPEKLRSSL